MGKSCAVPGCKTGTNSDRTRRINLGLRQISLFSVPKSDERRDEWQKILGCELEKKQAVCQLHFEAKYVKRSEKITLIDGTVYESPRDRCHLVNDAVPTLEQLVSSDCENDGSSADKTDQKKNGGENKAVENPLLLEGGNEDVSNEMTVTSQCSSVQTVEEVLLNNVGKGVFTVKLLKEELETAPLPESWAWTGKSSGITFTLLDPFNFHPRVQLEVAQDLSVQIRTITDTVIPLTDPVTCMTDIYDYLRSLKNRSICRGTGIEEESRDHRCIGILEDDEEYQRALPQPRCTMCRLLRKKLQQRTKRCRYRGDGKTSRRKPSIKPKHVDTYVENSTRSILQL